MICYYLKLSTVLPCESTAPIAKFDEFEVTMKGFGKSVNFNIGSLGNIGSSFLKHEVKAFVIFTKLFMNSIGSRWYRVFHDRSYFFRFGFTPLGVPMCPRYETSFLRNSLFANCMLKIVLLSLSKISFKCITCSVRMWSTQLCHQHITVY